MMAHGTVGSSPAPVVVPPRKSPYERLKHDLERDSRVAQELAQGKRVGFYKLKGQLGSGNFSRVKLAYHLLSNGGLFVMYNLVVMHDYILKFCMNSRTAGQYFTKF